MAKEYRLKAKVWIYPGEAAWHFVNIDKEQSAIIKKVHGKYARGFGSLPVLVTLGKTKWKTSIFPDSRAGSYLLPLKVAVRRAEQIEEGDTISFHFTIGL